MNKSGKAISHGFTTFSFCVRSTHVMEMTLKVKVEHKTRKNIDSHGRSHVIQDPFLSFL